MILKKLDNYLLKNGWRKITTTKKIGTIEYSLSDDIQNTCLKIKYTKDNFITLEFWQNSNKIMSNPMFYSRPTFNINQPKETVAILIRSLALQTGKYINLQQKTIIDICLNLS